jgi:hypothetical protein
MNFKVSSFLAVVAAVSLVQVQAYNFLLEPEARRLIGINPSDQQCTLVVGPHDGQFDPPKLLERKQYEEKQISGGKVRSVHFSDTSGILKAHLHTLTTQDKGVATWFTMDGFPLQQAWAYYQIDYPTIYGQPTTKIFKVLQGDDCFKFIDPAGISDTSLDKMMVQVFYENGDPHKQSSKAQPKRLSSEKSP